ncbi:MAG: BatA and WFA domain-containing protein [Gemmataceae bacterium]
MTFLHAYLLGGLVLAGIPVLLHLLLRQKPRRLPFPAFRFLKARHRINQRRLQLQHLLLLLLRILVLAALCLALARPLLVSHHLGRPDDRPVVATLLFDTSASMEYSVGGVSRLDDARTRARELLAEMKSDSRVAILDAAEEAPPTLLPPVEARSRLESLRLRPGAGSLNGAVVRALRFLQQQEGGEDGPPRLLYVFTDRTRASWEMTGLRPTLPEGVNVLLVDVGVDTPRDLGIERVEIVPPVVAAGARFEVRVQVRGTPGGHENELSCLIEGEDRPPDRRPVLLEKGLTSDTLVFERTAPTPPTTATGDVPYQITVRLGTRDALPFNNTRQATFQVRVGRKLLTLVDRRDDAATRIWTAAHAATRSFQVEMRTFDEADKLTARDLTGFSVMALFENSAVPEGWWKRLQSHTRAGGGLAIIPGGEEVTGGLANFNKQGLTAGLLPAPLDRLVDAPAGKPVVWERFSGAHPLMAPFVAWTRTVDPDFARDDLRPFVRRYWAVGTPVSDAITIAHYADGSRRPALLERPAGKGRVVLFTSPLDFRFIDARRTLQWNNYWTDSSFGLVLIDRVCRYLGGEVAVPQLNFTCGQVARLQLTTLPQPPLTLAGPDLAGAERTVKPPGEDGVVLLPQAVAPGNYLLQEGRGQTVAGFSLAIAPLEGDLERHSVESLEEIFGADTVVQVGRSLSLKEALSQVRQPPIELLPYLMLLLLAFLSLEGWLGNRFYRRESPTGEAP